MSLVCLPILWVSGCRLPSSGSYPIHTLSESIDLVWASPVELPVLPGHAIIRYNVYVREHGIGVWRQVGQASASVDPGIILHHSEIGNGEFDFGVSAVYEDGRESALHASFDASAEPAGGWYLVWQ
jgi:hypothetical protein